MYGNKFDRTNVHLPFVRTDMAIHDIKNSVSFPQFVRSAVTFPGAAEMIMSVGA